MPPVLKNWCIMSCANCTREFTHKTQTTEKNADLLFANFSVCVDRVCWRNVDVGHLGNVFEIPSDQTYNEQTAVFAMCFDRTAYLLFCRCPSLSIARSRTTRRFGSHSAHCSEQTQSIDSPTNTNTLEADLEYERRHRTRHCVRTNIRNLTDKHVTYLRAPHRDLFVAECVLEQEFVRRRVRQQVGNDVRNIASCKQFAYE